MTCGHFLDDRPEEAVLLLEAALIIGQELIEMMEQHPIENSLLGMAEAIDSWHGKRVESKTEPGMRTAR